MLPDSMNVGVIAENIKKLEVMVKEAGSELPTPGAGDTGKILKVGSDGYELATEYSYTPPSFSSTSEVNTGQKWIDGKDIYQRAFTFTTPETGSLSIGTIENIDHVLQMESIVYANNGAFYDRSEISNLNITINKTTGVATAPAPSSLNFQNCDSTLFVKYTKSAPAPGNETKKKTSKKGE